MKAETLKKAILQYAMQGKLVEQNPEDEPASVLLERIKTEKEQLIKDGKIKKEKPLPPITEDEIPYELPKGWEWVRLNNIINLTSGQDLPPNMYNSLQNGIPYITGASNIENEKVIINRWTDNGKAFAYLGNLLLTCKGTVGTMAILEQPKVHIARQIMAIDTLSNVDTIYVKIVLESYINSLKSSAKSIIPGISRDDVLAILFPLPPLAEQERIVEKLEQILPLVEEYGKNEEKLSKLNSTLPDKIKQSILQHAVQGKLVPQNPSDESASELLKRIKAEKEQLIKDGKIKKEKPLPPITEDEIPYELPKGWEWVRLRDICEILNGYAFKSDSYVTKSNNQIIRLGNVKNNGLALETSPVYIPDTIAKNAVNYLLKENDILITLTGTRLKRDYFYTALVKRNNIEQFNLYLNQRVGCLRFYSDVNPKLLNIFLKSKLILDNIFEHETGTANQGNIGTGATGELLIPLPPLAEQQRIVTKVEELLSIVESLKR